MLLYQCLFLVCLFSLHQVAFGNFCVGCDKQRAKRSTIRTARGRYQAVITPKNGFPDNEIPLNVIKDLDSVQSMEDLIERFITNKEEAREPPEPPRILPALEGPETRTRFPVLAVSERTGATAQIPAQATCLPRNVTIATVDLVEPGVIYWPSCMTMMRCGGCCGSDLLECQPELITNEHYKVVRMVYEQGGLEYDRTQVVEIERHVKCSCQCITKEEHCAPSQQYNASKCRCECDNIQEEEECYADSEKIWEYSSCSCKCRNEKPCSSGLYFSHQTCSCQKALTVSVRGDSVMTIPSASTTANISKFVQLFLIFQGVNLFLKQTHRMIL